MKRPDSGSLEAELLVSPIVVMALLVALAVALVFAACKLTDAGPVPDSALSISILNP